MLNPSLVAAQGEDLIAHGIELRNTQRDHEALTVFQRATAEQRTPRAVAQLGLCEHALGMWVEAESHLQEALRATQDPWIVKNG
jgi:Flp pilus assembly protein TadD